MSLRFRWCFGGSVGSGTSGGDLEDDDDAFASTNVVIMKDVMYNACMTKLRFRVGLLKLPLS